MKNKKFRKIAILVAVMMLVMSFSSTGFASWLDQTIKASYRNISVYVNGTMKQAKTATGAVVEPFIVDGTTYVPLRGIAEMLGYQVNFNPTTYRIDITGTDISALTARIIQQEATIKSLEAKLAAQEVDLEDLEDQLKDDYDEIEGIDIEDIVLDGDEDDIEVEIYVDLDTTALYDDWMDLTDSEIEDFLQDIVDDILDEFPDADITGFIEDEFDDDELEEFYINSKGNVVLGSGSSSSGDLADLEDQLKDDYTDIEGFDIEDIILDGDEDDVEVEVYVYLNNADYADWMDDVSDAEVESFLQDIVDDILDEFPDADITGFIEDEYDDEKLVDFDIDSNGDVDVDFNY